MTAGSAGNAAAPIWIGIDVGGTFTDAVLYDTASGELRQAKTPSTPATPGRAVLDALDALGAEPARVGRIVHGITTGTNAVLERRGADVWVITTRGFRDTLEIARTERRELYDIKTLKPASLVPRTRVLEVDERLRHDGSAARALDEADLERAVARLAAGGACSVAICFLHSYANPAHEQRAAQAIAAALPGAFVSVSSEVLPEMREYERFSTAVLNAYIGPVMKGYLDALGKALERRGHRHPLYLTTSSGGVATAERAARFPVHTVLSGPAGGVAAALELGRKLGEPNLITYDMGGTSTDVCLIEDGHAPVTHEQSIGGYPNRTPQIEIATVGAGGGSIAWLDAGDMLEVGPRSAGADPGPVAYGRGGTEITVTDANLVLGRLSAAHPLASGLTLDAGLARAALEALAARVGGLGVEALAEGLVRIAVARMTSAIKEISIARGHDPRDFAILAYGGAGPMHAAFIAEELEIDHVIVPTGPGNFSAYGCLTSDLRNTYVRTLLLDTRNGEFAVLAAALAELEAEGRASLAADGVKPADMDFRRELGMRYVGQSWELGVAFAPEVDSMASVTAAFEATHLRRYGHASGAPSEIVSVRVMAIGRVAKPAPAVTRATGEAVTSNRRVWFDGAFHDTPVLDRARLGPDARHAGPALVEEMGALTVVPPGWTLDAGALGELRLRRDAGADPS